MAEATTPIPRILIVEDDPDQRDLLCESLGIHYGQPGRRNVVGVGSAVEALAMDLSQFDVVLQDYNLPDMSGLTLLENILARADLPVIVVTSENVSETATEAIRRGAQDYVVKRGDYLFAIPCLVDKSIRQHRVKQENQRLQRQLQQAMLELQDRNGQLESTNRLLRTMATTDHLTGLANRRSFNETLERYFSEASRYGFDLTCCMCDLDDYKALNDALGHQVGDEVLILTAEAVRCTLRSTDVAARYGGDEFVLLLPHTSVEAAVAVGERIRAEAAHRTRHYAQAGRTVTMSVGVASLRADHPNCPDALVAQADRALYAAKEQGKNRILPFGQVPPAEVTT